MRPDSFAARAATYSNRAWHAELAERFAGWLGFVAGLTAVNVGTGTGMTVVDIGTGTGFAALAVAGAAGTRVQGVDRSPAMIEVARERAGAAGRSGTVTFAVGDAHRLRLRDRCADTVLFVTSLHYMTLGPALAEAARIVRPGGTVAIAALRTEALVPSALFRAVPAEHGVEVPDRMAATGSPEQLAAIA
ncbi:MAG TPA: class I SAM-dependent methyltransferase [Streptosporangiaceae bacterium]|jgi:ubiquinone/menaquinone biosynthesis C-methylase UbiE